MKNELLKAFIKSMMYETTTKVFGEISLENMRIIDSTIKYFNDTFPKKIYSDVINSIPEITKEKEEKITKLLNLIHLLEERYNYNYYKIVYVLTHDCNISREMLKDEYLPLCVVYSTNRFKGTPKEKEIFSRIYTFLFIITETYSSIMNGHDNLKTYIISNINNKQILEELYFVLFFHKATPDSNKNRFHLYLEFEGKEELEKFALGYKEYYKENIKKQEQLKKEINDKKQAEQYLELLPRYERIIKDYIESGLYIDSYCKKIGINQADFRKIVNELKKHNHPLFEEYSKHANSVANTNYTIIKRYIDKMIKNLMADPGKYTLLDYYGDTKMSFKEARSILSQASNEAKKAFETFCKKYQNDHPIKREQAKAIGKEFPIGKVNGETVRREATEEEKEQALNMLDEKGIPLTLATFSEQLRRIVQNSIEPQHTGGQK